MQLQQQEPEPQPETGLQTQAQTPEQIIKAPSAPHTVTSARPTTTRGNSRHSAITAWYKQNAGSSFRRGIAWCQLMVVAFLFVSFPIGWLLWTRIPMLQGQYYLPVQMLVSLIFLALSGFVQRRWLMKYFYRQDTPLPESSDIRDIGSLIDRLLLMDMKNDAEIRRRLRLLLPRLQALDAPLLAERHYEYLNDIIHNHARANKQINKMSHENLLAVLDAYSRIGNVSALPDVQFIARGNATLYRSDAEVIAAAQRCLVHLKAVAEQQKQQDTLLRPADSAAAPDTLLRPAAFIAPPETDSLLRPADTNQHD